MMRAEARTTTIAPEADPLLIIGRAIRQTVDRDREIDMCRPSADPVVRTYRQTELDRLWNRTELLRAALSCFKASSPAGAYLQVAEASSIFDLVVSNDRDLEADKPLKGRMEHLLFSVADFLRTLADFDIAAIGADYLLGPHLNSWMPHEEALELIAR